MATNGEMIDQIQEWINTEGEILSDEQVIESNTNYAFAVCAYAMRVIPSANTLPII